MTPFHHTSDATLIAYGAGNLSEGVALVVACHLTVCSECREKIEIANAVGGLLLEDVPPSPLSPSRLAETLSKLDAPSAPEVVPDPSPGQSTSQSWLPSPLRPYRVGQWRWIGPGIKQIVVVPKVLGGSSARLLCLAPGAAIPYHGHNGVELACVLRGSFSDDRGRFAAGDVSEADEGMCHRPVAGTDGECICLVATDGPLRLYGLAGRLIQRLMRF